MGQSTTGAKEDQRNPKLLPKMREAEQMVTQHKNKNKHTPNKAIRKEKHCLFSSCKQSEN